MNEPSPESPEQMRERAQALIARSWEADDKEAGAMIRQAVELLRASVEAARNASSMPPSN